MDSKQVEKNKGVCEAWSSAVCQRPRKSLSKYNYKRRLCANWPPGNTAPHPKKNLCCFGILAWPARAPACPVRAVPPPPSSLPASRTAHFFYVLLLGLWQHECLAVWQTGARGLNAIKKGVWAAQRPSPTCPSAAESPTPP